ncbi:MAG: hypothetical protein M0P66_15520 [Salinivirgaceae bacterium]|nr:hypothetical protein [Salinivirgaceae bacterium]
MEITNSSGTLSKKYFYDACSVTPGLLQVCAAKPVGGTNPARVTKREGKRRNPTNWAQADTRTGLLIDRGYTGHEHMDAFGLINMNGRVYDPAVALFLSPDPVLQDPANALNYNRYSYVLNNPLKYTDPSGYLKMSLFDALAYLWNSPYGGTWAAGAGGVGDASRFTSESQATHAGYDYMNSTGSFPNGNDMHEAYRFYQSNSRYIRAVQTNGFSASSLGTTSFAYFSKYFSHFEYGGDQILEGGEKNVPGGDWDFWGDGGNVKYKGNALGGTNYIGPGPDKNPYTIDLDPVDELDAAARAHDYAYWQAKTGGFKGAKSNTNVRFADADLVYSAISIINRYYLGGIDLVTGQPISDRTFNLANAVYLFFAPIVVEKFRREGVNYPMLYPFE